MLLLSLSQIEDDLFCLVDTWPGVDLFPSGYQVERELEDVLLLKSLEFLQRQVDPFDIALLYKGVILSAWPL